MRTLSIVASILALALLHAGCGEPACVGDDCNMLVRFNANDEGTAGEETSDESRVAGERVSVRPRVGANDTRFWDLEDPEALASRLAAAGLGIVPIELNPAVIGEKRGCRGTPDEVRLDPAAYRELVEANRRHDLVTLVVLVNWNGCAERRMSDAEFLDRLGVVLSAGADRVWIEPVSEPFAHHGTFDPKPRRWTELARERWTGTFVIPNFAGGQTVAIGPAFPDVPHDYVDYHPCSVENAEAALRRPGNHLVMTDCTPVFDPGPGAAANLTQISLETGVPFVVYGWVDPHRLQADTLSAMRDVIGG